MYERSDCFKLAIFRVRNWFFYCFKTAKKYFKESYSTELFDIFHSAHWIIYIAIVTCILNKRYTLRIIVLIDYHWSIKWSIVSTIYCLLNIYNMDIHGLIILPSINRSAEYIELKPFIIQILLHKLYHSNFYSFKKSVQNG